MLAQTVGIVDVVVILAYLLVVAYLGWLGYRQTKTPADYMLAGRDAHPFVMAISYGATFISTSAIVGFGGVAGMFGMSLLWLTFLNIFVGIFIAFVVLGGPVRRIGHALDAHTFPELLGRRFDSRGIQILAGAVIFLFMPLYAAAVMIGGSEFITTAFNLDYGVALLIFSLIVAAYVIAGGLKAVMYTDALQGSIMFIGMAVLLVWAYMQLGGVTKAHQELTSMAGAAFPGHKAMGLSGWTAMPQFGWGQGRFDLWWIVVTTIVMGVGIGVLAQPQLSVRFMTVKSRKQLNRAVGVGGLFILLMTGVAFTVGALSNAYFFKHEVIEGTLVSVTDPAAVVAKRTRLGDTTVSCRLLHIDTKGEGVANTHIIERGLGKFEAALPHAQVEYLEDGRVRVRPQATGFTRAVIQVGKDWMLNPDSIIPTYVISAMPRWFGLVFMLTLLAAAMSTLSSQFHTMGTALGRDVIEQVGRVQHKGIGITRLGICVGLVIAVIIGFYARGGYIIARATSIFFGLCASAFLPTLIGGLFFKRMTKPAALASMTVGFLVTTFWVLLVKSAEAGDIGLVYAITGNKPSILMASPNWPNVDPLLVALPLSALTAVVVSLLTKPPSAEHLARCFGPTTKEAAPARAAELIKN